MKYDFKGTQEAVWFVVVAVLTTLMQALITFDPNAVTDWRVWAIGLAAASVRTAASAILSWMGSHPRDSDR